MLSCHRCGANLNRQGYGQLSFDTRESYVFCMMCWQQFKTMSGDWIIPHELRQEKTMKVSAPTPEHRTTKDLASEFARIDAELVSAQCEFDRVQSRIESLMATKRDLEARLKQAVGNNVPEKFFHVDSDRLVHVAVAGVRVCRMVNE